MEFQLSYFISWKIMLWKCCTQFASKFGKLSKRSVFIPIPKKGNAKECSNYCTTALISHASKVMLKILQARLQQYVNRELPDVQEKVLEKAEEPEIKLPTSAGSSKKEESSRKTSISALLTMWTVWITIQIRSHSEILGVRTSTHKFWEGHSTHNRPTSLLSSFKHA